MSDPAGADGRPYAVLDIDGVLADVRHRLRHIEGRRKDWAAFFAAAPDDEPLPEGLAVAQRLAADHAIVYLTGRPERCRADTEAWLRRHGLPAGRVLMRAEGDRRPARQAKPRLLARLAASGRIAVVVDDDPAVCAALQAAGWPVLVADWMGRPAALDAAQEREGRT
jgi:phosphoglycolate phosphatase-like HAD superfamily hydrolase